ncbi:Ig-like domain-containing protein [Candidatus Daviesbacteria bacterium]|nr:Ig-like domain-containing protein [Candidatus Daviesbacteria bacterium]
MKKLLLSVFLSLLVIGGSLIFFSSGDDSKNINPKRVYAQSTACRVPAKDIIIEDKTGIQETQAKPCSGQGEKFYADFTSQPPPQSSTFTFVAPNASNQTFCKMQVSLGNNNPNIYGDGSGSRKCYLTPSKSVVNSGESIKINFSWETGDNACFGDGDCDTTVTVNPITPPVNQPAPTPTPTPPPLPSPSASPSPLAAQGTPVSIQPEIINPVDNSTLVGINTIEVKANENSRVDLYIQTTTGVIGSVLLTSVNTSNTQSATFDWDTTNTPNGTYELYAIVIRVGDPQVIVGPVLVKVSNLSISLSSPPPSLSPTGSPIPRPKVTPVPSSAAARRSPAPGASFSPKPLPSGVLRPQPGEEETLEPGSEVATSEDIIFPSEFDPQQVAEDKNTKITKLENTKIKNDVALTFTGQAEPNKIVTLIIYSNPIVVTVKTDANGTWTYHLLKPLEPGKHVAYVVVPQSGKAKVRSQAAEFIIAPSVAATSGDESLILASASSDKPLIQFALVTGLIIFVGVASLLLVYRFKKSNVVTFGSDKFIPPNNGQS